MNTSMYGTGFVPRMDPRDENYSMSAIVGDNEGSGPVIWRVGPTRVNQGSKPSCVGHSCFNWLRSGPIFNRRRKMKPMGITPIEIWGEAQELGDGYRDPDEGAHIRYGFEWLRQKGVVSSYYNAPGGSGMYVNPTTPEQEAYNERSKAKAAESAGLLIACIRTAGPLVIGVPWYSSFYSPKGEFLEKQPDTYSTGGHAIHVFGVDEDSESEYVWVENSWGDQWGCKGPAEDHGRGFIKLRRPLLEELLIWSASATIATEAKA